MLPDGSVGLVKDQIFPKSIDSAPNCGVRILDVEIRNLNKLDINGFLQKLSLEINTTQLITSYLNRAELKDVLLGGLERISKDALFDGELDNSEMHGNMQNCKFDLNIEEIKKYYDNSISGLYKFLMKYRLNTLGTPSTHSVYVFLINLNENTTKLRFTIHCGSGLFGRKIYTNFCENKKFKKMSNYEQLQSFFSMQTITGNYGFFNRHLISKSIADVCKANFNLISEPKIVNDSPKNYISQEDFDGSSYYFHRHGAYRISSKKEYVLLPLKNPYISAPAYFFKAKKPIDTLNSMSHELGKLNKDISEFSDDLKIYNKGNFKFVKKIENIEDISNNQLEKYLNISELDITHKAKPIGIISNF